jgi:transcription-repair coupling factor (superfamily II helicase)
MNTFTYLLDGMVEFDTILKHIKNGTGYIHTLGVSGSQKSHLIYSLGEHILGKTVVIAADEREAGRIANELSFLFCDEVLYFPPREYMYYDVDVSNRKGEFSRLKAISRIENAKFLVTTISALTSYTLPKTLYDEYTVTLKSDSTVDMDDFVSKLVFMGYTRVSTVESVGQFGVRGSIIDVFSPASDKPYRIELWGDDIDSMRTFSAQSQLSMESVTECVICPARELIYTKEQAEEAVDKIRKLKNENLNRDIEKFSSGHYFHSNDKYMPVFYNEVSTLIDYMGRDTLYILDEPKELKKRFDVWYKEQNEIITALMEKGLFPRKLGSYFLTYSDIVLKTSISVGVSMSALSHSAPEVRPKELISMSAKTLRAYTDSVEYLVEDIEFWKNSGYRITVLLSTDVKIQNLMELLYKRGIVASHLQNRDYTPDFGEVILLKGNLDRGFEYPSIKTVVVTDGQQTKKRQPKRTKDSKDAIKSFEEISIGDYVVHRTHGVGQYVGINQLEVQGVVRDYIKLKYKGTDCLYVPVNQLDLLYKYSSTEEKNVKLNSLGGTAWQKTVTKVKESVAHLAEDMIKLYAERSSLKGHVFSKDTDWQKQFEGDFLYDETPDQLRCIEEVKADMEQGKCMDRLLCGDVGYGKTEVALRAAFKCVMEGMQVAYLVPTTILASQHFNTFVSRMKEYCINVEMLSRFRTKKQQQEIVAKLKTGEIDVIIGTHRLLQKDVEFKSLGLLIIDEEQRFGVGHKEKLVEMKKNVNVLTLSATPIPRTLNMAMIGIRDLSVITSPPSDRLPVQTFVMEYSPIVVQNAIGRELSRGGQVYYLYNRVDSIERVATKIKELVPEARVSVAHGKMTETQLENIMLDLIDGEIDVLVCTTIIETGLDVPNVNTIILENADCLGLSQLYQLKGRVGRSNRLSYAYFTYHEGKVLDQTAQKRLQAIREFTEFGAGFKIALRDLEIRGAGNILGKEQHGNMNLVGYDMYCLLLEQAVKELKGEKITEKCETSIDIKVSAFIPEKVVEDEKQRIDMYRRIASITTEEDKLEVESEFIDRYGDIPQSVDNLMKIALIKELASNLYVSDISQKDDLIIFTLQREISAIAIVEIMDKYRGKMMFSSGSTSYLSYKYDADILDNIKIILQCLQNAIHEEQL